MSRLVGTLLVAGLLVAGANAQDPLFRMFFDIEGTGGADNASHRPGDHNLSYGNPVLPAGGGRRGRTAADRYALGRRGLRLLKLREQS